MIDARFVARTIITYFDLQAPIEVAQARAPRAVTW